MVSARARPVWSVGGRSMGEYSTVVVGLFTCDGGSGKVDQPTSGVAALRAILGSVFTEANGTRMLGDLHGRKQYATTGEQMGRNKR